MFFSIYTVTTVKSDLAARESPRVYDKASRAIETTRTRSSSADTIEGASFCLIILNIRKRFAEIIRSNISTVIVYYVISHQIDWNSGT